MTTTTDGVRSTRNEFLQTRLQLEYRDGERKRVEYRVHRYLSTWYRKLGFFIAKYALSFIIVPVIVSVALCTGIIYLDVNEDVEHLFVPENAISLQDRQFIHKWFLTNNSADVDPSRLHDLGRFGAIIATAKDRGNMLREKVFKDIIDLNEIIQNITIEHKGNIYSYKEICAESNGHCVDNDILKLSWKMKAIEKGKDRIKFPVDYSNKTYNYTFYIMNLGGVTRDENNFVEEAKAIRLLYYLKNDNEEQTEIAHKWEEKFIDVVSKFHQESISTYLFSKFSLDNILSDYLKRVPPIAIITGAVMLIYSILSCMKLDFVTSKPWLGVAALCSVLLALASTFGLMSYCNIQMNLVAGMVAFLIFGIGMDDAFILIGAWRQTNRSEKVPKRMADAYSEAATSITITSLTNTLCFCVSIIVPFPGIRVFCLYATTAVIFVFVYQITFFGGCMTYSGHREAQNLSPFTFRPVTTDVTEKGIYQTVSTWIKNRIRFPHSEVKKQVAGNQPVLSSFVAFISDLRTKIVILFIIVAFACICIWSTLRLKEGQDFSTSFPYNSTSSLFLKMRSNYFAEFPYRLQVVVKDKLDYSDPYVQNRLETLLQKLEHTPHIGDSSLTESWLRFYLIFSKMKEAKWSISSYNLSSKDDFINALWNVFLKYPQTKHLAKDLIFNDDHSEILYSRFMVQAVNLFDSEAEKALIARVREVVEESDIPVSVYTSWFPLHEQLLTVKETATRTLIIATVVTLATFFVFVPNIIHSLCAALCVGSIEVGAIGIMSIWGVNLDLTSTTVLVMSVGFSIDYTAHMCFAYTGSKASSWKGRYEESIRKLGLPILQSATTTILGIVSLGFTDSHCYVVFFKIVFLVTTISAVHAFFVLPLLINSCEVLFRRKDKSTTLASDSVNIDVGESLMTVE